ncbi:MAG: hypothetical protein WBP61_06630, partial [Nocardioides sp.]
MESDRPVGDPFWDAVHRRHPDVDLVLLAPGRPGDATPAPPSAEDAAVDAAEPAVVDAALAAASD